MRVAVIRRTVLTASAVSLALSVTACGAGAQGDGGDAGKEGKGGSAPGKAAVKALSAAELGERVIAQGDVKGHQVEKPGKDDVFAPGSVSAGKAACEPVAQVLSSLPVGKPVSRVQRLVVHKPAEAEKGMPSTDKLAGMTEKEAGDAALDSLDITKTMTSLWSYDGDGAARALAALRKAGKACAGGFTMTADGEKQQVTKVTEEKLSAGQEAVAWTVGTKQGGSAADTKVVVFRQGATLAGFSSFNIAAISRGEKFGQPAAVIEAQEAKLR